jgi:site-specific recombinase XerD
MSIMKNEIYNHKQKDEYLKALSDDKIRYDILEKLFKMIGRAEAHINADVADMDNVQIGQMFEFLKVSSETAIRQYVSTLKPYVMWVYRKEYNENEELSPIIKGVAVSKVDISKLIANKMIGSLEHMREMLDYVYEDTESFLEVKSARDRLLFGLLYLGIKVQEIHNLRKVDINYNTKEVVVDDRTYTVSDDLVENWRVYSNADKIEVTGQGGYREVPLFYSEYLFRNQVRNDATDRMDIDTIRNIVKRFWKVYNEGTNEVVNVTADNVRQSGLFYKAFFDEETGVKITREYLVELFGKDCSDDNGDLSRKRLYDMTNKLLTDYNNWKYVFHISKH